MIRNALRHTALATLTLLSLGTLANPSHAGVTDNASNSYEYNAHVYSYCARSMVLNMPAAIENQLQHATSQDEFDELLTELNWAEEAADFTNRGFKHAYAALRNNDDSEWADCVDDLYAALQACELLLAYQQSMDHASQGRINSVQSAIYYLEIALENASFAQLASSTRMGGFSRR